MSPALKLNSFRLADFYNKHKTSFLISMKGTLVGMAVIPVLVVIAPLQIQVNMSHSLPGVAYQLEPLTGPIQRGDIIKFSPNVKSDAGANPRYPDGVFFGKTVIGVPGDVIRHEAGAIVVNGTRLAVKTFDTRGFVLTPLVADGAIPAGHYFVAGDHRDSFDSRYESVGLVPQAAVTGKVNVLF